MHVSNFQIASHKDLVCC